MSNDEKKCVMGVHSTVAIISYVIFGFVVALGIGMIIIHHNHGSIGIKKSQTVGFAISISVSLVIAIILLIISLTVRVSCVNDASKKLE